MVLKQAAAVQPCPVLAMQSVCDCKTACVGAVSFRRQKVPEVTAAAVGVAAAVAAGKRCCQDCCRTWQLSRSNMI